MTVTRNPKSDPQRNQLYAAETTFRRPSAFDRGITARQARELIKDVRFRYSIVEPVTLHFTKSKEWWGMLMQYDYDLMFHAPRPPFRVVANGSVNLDLQGLLHELAHLVDVMYLERHPNAQQHGPSFCGIAACLYDYYDVMPITAYRALLREYGVKCKPPEQCSPEALLTQRKGRR
jgi:hypothetical protein